MMAFLATLALLQPETDPLRTELASEVQKMLELGSPASAVVVVGIGGAYHCFANSGEVLFTLSEALPYLPARMQPEVKEYLKKVVREHAPWTQAFLLSPSPWPLYAPQPPDVKGPQRLDVPVANAYFAWKYAEATGDWASIEKGYGDFKAHFGRVKELPQDYPQTAGAIGFAKLARHFGMTADAADAEAKAARGLEAGREFEKIFDTNLSRHLNSHDWAYPPFTERRREKVVITAYAPEVFRMLHDTAQEEVKRHAGAVMDAWARTWFLTRPNLPTFYGPNYFKAGPEEAPHFMKQAWKGEQHDFGQENATWTPDVACTFFLIRAYVLGEKGSELKKFLDVPWIRVGDLYHLQKLIAAIRAH
jgi:hypothetical protein